MQIEGEERREERWEKRFEKILRSDASLLVLEIHMLSLVSRNLCCQDITSILVKSADIPCYTFLRLRSRETTFSILCHKFSLHRLSKSVLTYPRSTHLDTIMANYLASIFGTEQDKVCNSLPPTLSKNFSNNIFPGQLLLLLQNRCLPPRRPLFAQTRQTLLLANDPPPQPLPEPRLRPKEQDEPLAAAEPLRCLLRGFLVRDVQVW